MTSIDLNSDALAPVANEISVDLPQVSGTVPADLNGQLIRNGPNPYSGRFGGSEVLDWWPEAAMLHGLEIASGTVRSYRNRWLRTQAWARHTGARDADSYVETNPNVNIVRHAGKVMALGEGVVPLEVNAALETLGIPATHAGFPRGFTGHPKLDTKTGELVGFKQDWMPPFLQYMTFDQSGRQTRVQEIAMDSPSMMHDMAITHSFCIFFDLSVSIDFAMLEQGYRLPIRWHDERPSRIGVVSRADGAVRWFEIEPCFIQHFVNAYEVRDTIVVDAVRYPWYFKFDRLQKAFAQNPLGNLWRYEIDLNIGSVSAWPLAEQHIELPRINEALTGADHRYLYAVEQPTEDEMRVVIKYDLARQTFSRHKIPHGDQNSEPVFVAREGATDEDDGWLLVCVYRGKTDTSDVLILDARDIEHAPVATVTLPCRIPAGFHGAWIPA